MDIVEAFLTVYVDGEGGGEGCELRTVGGLTGESATKVLAPHPVQPQHVPYPASRQDLAAVVQEDAVPPPADLRLWVT